VSGIDAVHLYGSLDSLGTLRSAILDSKPQVIVPCDDGVVWQLHALYEQFSDLRPMIEDSLGSAEMFPTIRSRGQLLKTASDLGIRIPLTEEINSREDLAKWPLSSGVLKVDGSWGGSGVEITSSATESLAAYNRLSKPKGFGFAWKQFLVNKNPVALWFWKSTNNPRITMQQFICGRPANTMFACWKGEVLAIVTVEVLSTQGATGSATVVRVIQNSEIAEAARGLAKKLGLNGFHGLDFILEEDTGNAFLIEMNPRCTQLGHLELPGQGDLAGAFTSKLRSDDPTPPHKPIESDTIAFFPQAFLLNSKNPYLASGYHDVPWEEPALLRELLQGPWPDRQWAAQLYHFFRPPKQTLELRVEDRLTDS
jgi:hypothetical protein